MVLYDHLLDLTDQGQPKSTAMTLVCALAWAVPRIPRPLKQGLPQTFANLRGWANITPGGTLFPVPYEVAWAIALAVLEAGSPRASLLFRITFEAYLRPS